MLYFPADSRSQRVPTPLTSQRGRAETARLVQYPKQCRGQQPTRCYKVSARGTSCMIIPTCFSLHKKALQRQRVLSSTPNSAWVNSPPAVTRSVQGKNSIELKGTNASEVQDRYFRRMFIPTCLSLHKDVVHVESSSPQVLGFSNSQPAFLCRKVIS